MHLFVDCAISQGIWREVLNQLQFRGNWNRPSLQENLLYWFFSFPNHKTIPFHILWGIWNYRNKILFEDLPRNDGLICSRIIMEIKEYKDDSEGIILDYILSPVYFENKPIGFFDGVAAGGKCGVGIFLKFSSEHVIKATIVVGEGTNTKAEILGLWGLLSLAKFLHLNELMIAGDSKVIIDWFEGKCTIHSQVLSPWQQKIQAYKSHFTWLHNMHIHRQFNIIADSLSKF
jgi:ribonuclease HI